MNLYMAKLKSPPFRLRTPFLDAGVLKPNHNNRT